jgi:hypothetical protein
MTEKGEKLKLSPENKYVSKNIDSSVSIFQGYRLRARGLWVPFCAGTGVFSIFTLSSSSLGLGKPPIELVPGDVSPQVNRLRTSTFT